MSTHPPLGRIGNVTQMSVTLASALSTDVLWIVFVLISLVVATAVLSVSIHVGLAVAQDALPYLLSLAWVILGLALLNGAWVLAAMSAGLAPTAARIEARRVASYMGHS